MKFTYQKLEPLIFTPDSLTAHQWTLEGTDFKITASRLGVSMNGFSGYFLPVDEEMKIPEEFMKGLNYKLAQAFDFAHTEQEKERKDVKARQAILGAK